MSAVTKLMTPGGGGVALTPASSIASDVTVNVPSQNCTLGIQGPAFSAYTSAGQSISGGVNTKVLFNIERFDTNNNFASGRFTPTVAGYYQINTTVCHTAQYSIELTYIYKNGAEYTRGFQCQTAGGTYASGANCMLYLNGSTDYVEVYIYTGGASTIDAVGAAVSNFDGCLVRAA